VRPIVLFVVSGILFGGAWSLRSQGAGKPAVAIVVLLAVLALAGGVLWLIPKGS
jgi:hypothetical protein